MANDATRQRPVHANPTDPRRRARAPYNFAPLPEHIVTTDMPPDQDRYHDDKHTGWFDCEMETCSPVYVRGMMTLDQFDKADKKAKELSVEEKLERAPFYSYKQKDGRPLPVIPGSAIRGLIRSLVEIVGYGKMKWVNNIPKITFRSVAAGDKDPLTEPYQWLMGKGSDSVYAGYFKFDKVASKWWIQPAQRPKEVWPVSERWPTETKAWLPVKKNWIEPFVSNGDITGFRRFDDKWYKPAYFPVSFDVAPTTVRMGNKERRVIGISKIGDRSKGYKYKGVLVCSGNMRETNTEESDGDQKRDSHRSWYAMVLDEYRQDDRETPKSFIEDHVIEDYRQSLTDFQKSLWGGENGCLKENAPVFYVTIEDKIVWFGHTPNFRIPAFSQSGRAVTPLNFIPDEIRGGEKPDIAEAIFGWIQEGSVKMQFPQFAGRVFFSDACLDSAKEGIWHSNDPIVPSTLGSPKITTFQHYLVQDRNLGHDPDVRRSLAHYDQNYSQTEIRGHKLYWHKGARPNLEATTKELKKESQLTRIKPLRPGVKFRFRVYFENLKPEELGALAWALTLPGEDGQTYRHKLGMGKPLGMGAVAITAQLYLTNRRQRYESLFDDGRLLVAEEAGDPTEFITAFENFILREKNVAPDKRRLAEVRRIKMLLAMLQWRTADKAWLDETRYLLIEPENEYKDRPVLPDPLAVIDNQSNTARSNSTSRVERKKTATAPTEDESGIVKKFGLGKSKSYGFIISDLHHDEVHVHIKDLSGGIRSLEPGQKVIFKTRPGNKNREAYDVRLMEKA